MEFSKCICLCHCHCLCICLCHCFFLGQVMSPHHSDQMSQRTQVSRIALLRCSLNVFVFVIVFVSVFVIVFVFFLVRSCLLITLMKCHKGHKFYGRSLLSTLSTVLSLVRLLLTGEGGLQPKTLANLFNPIWCCCSPKNH